MLVLRFYGSGALSGIFKFNSPAAAADFEFSPAFMVFEKITQPDSADDVARVVYSRRPAAEAARVNNSRHTCCCIYFSKTISPSHLLQPALLLHGVHLFDFGDSGRVFRGFIFADEVDDAGEPQGKSGAAL